MEIRFFLCLLLGMVMGCTGCKSRSSLIREERVIRQNHSSLQLRDSLLWKGEQSTGTILRAQLRQITFSPPDSNRHQYVEQMSVLDMEEFTQDTCRIWIEQGSELMEQRRTYYEKEDKELVRREPWFKRWWLWGVLLALCVVGYVGIRILK